MELNLYGRAMAAKAKKEEDAKRQKASDAERLAMMVSRLIGERVQPDCEYIVYKIDDRHHLVFTFQDGSKDKLANQWECKQCEQWFRTPIEDLASLVEPLDLAHKREHPPHEGCPGIRSNKGLMSF